VADLKKRLLAAVEHSLSFVIYGAVAYFIVASVVFRFRHPWMTDTELIVHTIDALAFRAVPYHDARPR
jgi:hypothetical protein